MNLNFVGASCVKLAFFMALVGIVFSCWGAIAKREDLVRAGQRAVVSVWGLLLIAVLVLLRALVTRDYSLEYVAEEVDAAMPMHYRLAALWGGMNGSLLWWSLICATYMTVCLGVNRGRFRELMPWVSAVGCYVLAFLTFLISVKTFGCDPFTPLSESNPAKGVAEMIAATGDGRGLNPLLQTYWMMIHPPTLYVGYIGFTIPFAFCIAALVTGRVDAEFLRATRRWTLWAWMVLGFGVLLGSKWAYEELGWGGYWGWDPVENASLMPFLVATAYVHSVIIQEKRGMLKGWNVFLILLTFIMTYFGTFLTRSGIVQSVHAFGSGPVGWVLGGFILSLVAVCAFLLVFRWDKLQAENEIEAVMSREATFLYNNVGLLGFMLMVFVGTMFPVLSEAIKGNKVVVGPPFFNPLAGLLTIGLFVLMGIGQLVAWRKTSPEAMMRNFSVPLIVTGVSWLAFVLFLPKDTQFLGIAWANPWAVALWTSCVFVAAGIVWEYVIGTRAVLSSHRTEIVAAYADGKRAPPAFLIGMGVTFAGIGWSVASVLLQASAWYVRFGMGVATGVLAVVACVALSSGQGAHATMHAITTLFARNRRRYGGYVVHLGLAVLVAGITGSSLFKLDKTFTFKPGETKSISRWDFTYNGLELKREPGYWNLVGFLEISESGKRLGMAYPARRIYDKGEQPTTEVSIHETAARDVYTILETYTDERISRSQERTATIRILIAPMVTWLWAGGIVMVIGTALAAWPQRKRVLVAATSEEPARAEPKREPATATARSIT